MSKYDEATRERIKELWATTMPASRIAKEVGLTKGQVMGLKNRMGLPPRGLPTNFQKGPSKGPQSRQDEPKLKPAPVTAEDIKRVLSAPSGSVSPFKTCQWFPSDVHSPFRDEDKCGKPTLSGRSYCAEHHRRSVVQQRGTA